MCRGKLQLRLIGYCRRIDERNHTDKGRSPTTLQSVRCCPVVRWNAKHLVFVVVNREPHLLKVVDALRSPRRFASLLNGGQQQGDDYGENRNNYQKLVHRKRATDRSVRYHGSPSFLTACRLGKHA